ncbi:MAG: HNH endonuclease [Lachnospiraceae bacterium]|nr:HNH endonuclease [Lachnospiraceae bacterium]MCM1237530.1 HNH endonuclease [Ruminococcus flavefaciens]
MKIWKIIPKYPNYEASNEGDIRNRETQQELYKCKDEGYLAVNLKIDGTTIGRTIHQLVAMAFLPEDINRRDVNHIDRIKTNNNIDNLEWCNTQENTAHFWSQYGSEPIENHVYLTHNDEVILVTCAESKILRQQGWEYGNGITSVPWVIKGRCYVYKDNEEKLISQEKVADYLDSGWSKGRILRNLKGIFKDGVQKFVSEFEIPKFVSQGWSVGSIKQGWIKIIRDDEIRMIDPQLITFYKDQGWEKIKSEDNQVNIHLGEINKTISRNELQDYLIKGWRYGSYRKGLKGKRWVNSSVEDKCIDECELSQYLENGWVLGRISSGTMNKRSMTKNGIQKFFTEDEIPLRLAEGWKFESVSRGSTGKIWIYKGSNQMQIDKDELPIYSAEGWKEGRPKNMVFISNDALQKCIKVPMSEAQEYLNQGWRPGRIKKH